MTRTMSIRNFLWLFVVVIALVVIGMVEAGANEPLPKLPEMHPALLLKHAALSKTRRRLVVERMVLFERNKSLLASCQSVEANTPADYRCAAEDEALQAALSAHFEASHAWIDAYGSLHDAYLIEQILNYATTKKWSADDLKGLRESFAAFHGFDKSMVDPKIVKKIWEDIEARTQDSTLRKQAAAVKGFNATGMGTQSFEDCAVFALANATGVPYGAVASLATKFMSEGAWRLPQERKNPQAVIESKGLNGGEVLMLTEYLGRSQILQRGQFVSALSAAHPILVNVLPPIGVTSDGHQIVLTKAFKVGEITWFEAMDSNRRAVTKIYLTASELDTLIQETGIAYIPDGKRRVLPLH